MIAEQKKETRAFARAESRGYCANEKRARKLGAATLNTTPPANRCTSPAATCRASRLSSTPRPDRPRVADSPGAQLKQETPRGDPGRSAWLSTTGLTMIRIVMLSSQGDHAALDAPGILGPMQAARRSL